MRLTLNPLERERESVCAKVQHHSQVSEREKKSTHFGMLVTVLREQDESLNEREPISCVLLRLRVRREDPKENESARLSIKRREEIRT